MRLNFIFSLSMVALLFFRCTSNSKHVPESSKPDSIVTKNITGDTITAGSEMDSMPKFEITDHNYASDNNNLKVKRDNVRKDFLVVHSGWTYDTLVDLNYDGFRDYILGYYGLSGTGFKNRVAVYLYSKKKDDYLPNERLSDMVNPSFYLPEHKLTGYYIGLGGGGGVKLEWIENRWVETKIFEVNNNGDSTVWKIIYPLTNKTEKIIRPFQGIPPEEILETNWSF